MRRDNRQCTQAGDYYVTDEGREAMDSEQTCSCPEVGYERNMLVCRECGTVYAVATFKSYRSGWSKLAWQVDFGGPGE